MAKSLMIVGNGTNQLFTRAGSGSEVRYFVCANAPLILESTRANTQITYRSAGTISKARLNVHSNEFAVDATAVLEINGAAGNTSITIPAASAGTFTDDTHTDAIAVGDKVNWKITSDADDPGLAIRLVCASIIFAATTDTVVRHAAVNFAQEVNGLTNYAALSDNCSTLNITEVNARFDMNGAGTIKNLFVYVSQWTNTASFTATIKLRVNGANSALTVSPTGTGIIEDVTNSVTIAANDDVNYSIVTTGTGSITLEIVSVEWVSTAKEFHMIYGQTGAGFAQAFQTTNYTVAGGGGTLAGHAEIYFKVPFGFAALVSHLTAYTSTNLITDTPPLASEDTLRVRKNGALGSGSVSLTRGAGGSQVEDSALTDTFAATDDLSMESKTLGSVGSLTYRHFGMMVTNQDVTSRPAIVMLI